MLEKEITADPSSDMYVASQNWPTVDNSRNYTCDSKLYFVFNDTNVREIDFHLPDLVSCTTGSGYRSQKLK